MLDMQAGSLNLRWQRPTFFGPRQVLAPANPHCRALVTIVLQALHTPLTRLDANWRNLPNRAALVYKVSIAQRVSLPVDVAAALARVPAV